MTYKISFKNAEMTKSLIYILERSFPDKTFKFSVDKNEIEASDNNNQKEIEQLIADFCTKATTLTEKIQSKILWQSETNKSLQGQITESVSASNVPGAFLLSGKIPKIINRLDAILLKWLQSQDAEEVLIPSLIQRDDLVRAQVFERERHQISLLQQHNGAHSDVCLTPAACLPLYPILGKNGKNFANSIFTARCQVHRYENGVFGKDHALSRLWEFHVREIVGFGDSQFEHQMREKIIQLVKQISEVFNLPAVISTASDLFFHSEHSAYALHQLTFKTKLEFRVFINDQEMSVVSINSHGRHFVDKFSINCNEKDSSFCVGFGLERFALAIALATSDVQNLDQYWSSLEDRILKNV